LSEWDGLTQDNDISEVKKQASTGKVHENRAAAEGTMAVRLVPSWLML
jgi:hypothetical protein